MINNILNYKFNIINIIQCQMGWYVSYYCFSYIIIDNYIFKNVKNCGNINH